MLRLGFAGLAYLLFFAAFAYLVAFVGDFVVPHTVDHGPASPTGVAVVVDLALIALFGLQHSVMARPGFKAALTRVWPASIERSLYLVATVAVLAAMYLFWRSIPATLWAVEVPWGRDLLWALFGIGWATVFLSTWLLDHFELFGLRQAWAGYRGTPIPAPQFRKPLFYRHVRHPLYAGFLIAFWAIPVMTLGHLLFAVAMTGYVLIAIHYEERDLAHFLGADYVDYQHQVGMLVPGVGKLR